MWKRRNLVMDELDSTVSSFLCTSPIRWRSTRYSERTSSGAKPDTDVTALWRVMVLAGTIAVASCVFPVDKTRSIEFINQTGQRIVLWEQGRPYPGARYE